MIWGSFTTTHLLTLAFAFLLNLLLYFALIKETRSNQIIGLFILSLFGVGVVLSSLLNKETSAIRNLPLSFWSLNAVLLPFAVFTRNKKLCNLLLIWSFSSTCALIFNGEMANVEILSFDFLVYYVTHLLGAGIPILLFALKLVKLDVYSIKPIFEISTLTYVSVHFLNVLINTLFSWSVNEGVNYMSTLLPTNSLLNFFYALIPSSFWYALPIVPLISIYILYWYLPAIIDERKRTKPLRMKLKDVDRYYEEYEEEYIEEIIDEKYEGFI